jgi:hypothetical protein
MLSSSALSPTYLPNTPRTKAGTRKVELMTQPYLLLTRERARREQVCTHTDLACTLRSEDKERITRYVT